MAAEMVFETAVKRAVLSACAAHKLAAPMVQTLVLYSDEKSVFQMAVNWVACWAASKAALKDALSADLTAASRVSWSVVQKVDPSDSVGRGGK